MDSPVSVGQQSVIGFDKRSDIYLEKVNRWMDSNVYENDCDNISLGATEMLHEIVHDEDMDESYFSVSQCITKKHLEELPTSMSGASNGFQSSRCSSISKDQLMHTKTKDRVLSKDSGVDCVCQEYGGRKEHDAAMIHVTVIENHQPLLEAADNTTAMHGDPQPIVSNTTDEYGELQINDDSDSRSTTESSCYSFEQDTSDCLLGYKGGLSHYFDPEASKERGDDDEYPYIQNSGGCIEQQFNTTTSQMIVIKNNNRDTELACSEITKGVEQTVDYFGLEAIQSDKLEVVNQSRDILESGFDDELESTVEVGNCIESNVCDDSKDELESKPEWFSSPKENNAVIVHLKSTDAEKSGDLSRHESSELCQYVKHCNNFDSECPRSPDPVQ